MINYPEHTPSEQLHSFIVLAYKESPFLKECIKSLLDQTVKSKILISSSTPSAFLSSLAELYQIELRINPARSTIASDWNFAFNQANTPFVTLAHQDDIYSPDYTRKCLKAAQTFPECLLVFTDCYELVNNKQETRAINPGVKNLILAPFFAKKVSSLKNCYMKLLSVSFGNPISCPTVMYHKNSIIRTSNFNFCSNLSINLDWQAWIDLAKSEGSFVRVKEALVAHRIHQESENNQGLATNRRQNEDLKIFQSLWPSLIAKILVRIYSISYAQNLRSQG